MDNWNKIVVLLVTFFLSSCQSEPDTSTYHHIVLAEDVRLNLSELLKKDAASNPGLLEISSYKSPFVGKIIEDNGEYIYVPPREFYGQDQFSYTVTDGELYWTSNVVIEYTHVDDVAFEGAFLHLSQYENYSVQMHLHGHSNHNGAMKPGSMQWITNQAYLNNVADVLWWNDHTGFLGQADDLHFEINTPCVRLVVASNFY